MASVKASISFTCPNCAKVLRASARPPAGKKIKCPACGEAFVPELDDEEEKATRIQAKPSAKTKLAPRSEDDDRPRSKRGRADDDDDDRPQKKRRRDEDDDDDDDLPLKKKKKAKKKSGSMMWMFIGGGVLGVGALLSCVLCGVGAFLWPGFLLSKNNEMLAFVAPDANFLMGGRPKELKTKFAPFKDMFAQAAGPGGGNQFRELEDLIANSEQFLLFMNANDFGKKMVMVIKAEAGDIDRLKSSNKLEPAKTVGGHAIHKIRNAGFGGPERVVFADGRLVLLTDLDENQLVATLNRGKKDPAKSAAIDLSRSVDKSPLWMAMTFDGAVRGKLREGFDEAGKLSVGMKAAASAADGARGMTLTVDVTPGNDLKLALSMMCKNADDAAKVKKGAEEGWVLAKAGMAQAQNQVGAMMPFMNPLVKDLNSTAFSTQGDSAIATVAFSNQTIQEVAKAAKNNPFGMVAFGPQPMQPPQPGQNFGPKGNPKFDGAPPNNVPIVGQGKLVQNYTEINVQPLQRKDRVFQFQQNKRITVTMTSTVSAPRTDVDVFILQGNVGEFVVAADQSIGPNGAVTFVVPQTGAYRVRVANLGPGVATASVVNIYEQ